MSLFTLEIDEECHIDPSFVTVQPPDFSPY